MKPAECRLMVGFVTLHPPYIEPKNFFLKPIGVSDGIIK